MESHKRGMAPPSDVTVPDPDPTERTIAQLQREIGASREIVESKIEITRLVLETRLAGMDTAIAAALQSARELVGLQNASNLAAAAKSESATADSIKQLHMLFNSAIAALQAQVTDTKSRLDKGEGRSSISDPTTSDAMNRLGIAMNELKIANGMSTGHTKGVGDSWGVLLGGGGALMAFVTLMMLLLK